MKKLYIGVLTLFVLTTACSPTISVTKTEKFDPSASITIISKGDDDLGVQAKLEHLFLTHGFDIISESTAREKVKFQQELRSSSNSVTNEGEIESAKEISSVYALTFQYTSRIDIPAGRVFTSFNASVVKMIDGRLVASSGFSQGQWTGKKIDKVLESFVSKLVE